MNLDMTRRTLLHLAGASSLAAAAAAAARAEQGGSGGGPTFANRTPMRIGMVTIRVRKLDVVADYYRDVLGLAVMERSATGAVLGAGGVKLLALEARPDAANEARNAAGLYHTAFLMPTRKDLARWLVNAAIHRVPLSGFADHRVSESVYLDDPEGNGIEVYADRDPSLWQWSEGTVTMGTDQLDIDNLVSLTNTNVSDYAKAPDGLRIGHMHLRVGDLAKADGFYRGTLGFDPTRARSGAAFLSSGRYHHHLGLNVWQSAGAGRRDDAATGLAWFSLEIEKADLFTAKEERLRQAGVQVASVAGGLEAADPWGTRVRLVKV
ncbi:VOC family protein [Bradyrhizobium sp. AUGA SZCCT0177]|uniref:VOC family protein n=1 Tax=unclassified Bradyrhizobium TaxID=2631580 RepID=UPI001BACDC61|nr:MULTISPECIES: VOC family protein [unclassified Bradyrhizobium]MBR1233068.1 VOC family protein [Bradyrhizobium sp. AUGA SZCCT0182]MBR1281716.1 VOC family protein [Bradyrhizobium sp. AUGA SZCCT0177]